MRPLSEHLRSITNWLLLLAVVATLVLTVGVLTARWQAVPVISGSMESALPAGSLAIVEHRPTAELAVGDVIVFHAPTAQRPVTVHRVTQMSEQAGLSSIVTRGDANEEVDVWSPFTLATARVWTVRHAIPGLGRLVLWGRHPLAQLAAFVVVALAAVNLLGSWPRRWRRPAAGALTVAAAVTALLVVPVARPAQAAFAVGVADELTVGTSALAPPRGLTATPASVMGACEVSLAWTASPSPATAGYELLRQPLDGGMLPGDTGEPTGTFEVVLAVAGRDTTTATDTIGTDMLQLNNRFRYVARAYRDAWRSDHSDPADVEVLGVCI